MAPSFLRFALIALLAMTAMADTTGNEIMTTMVNDDGSTTEDESAVSISLVDSPSSDATEPPSTPGIPLDWIKRGGPIDDTTSADGPVKVYKGAPAPSPKKANKKKAAAKKIKKKGQAIKKKMMAAGM